MSVNDCCMRSTVVNKTQNATMYLTMPTVVGGVLFSLLSFCLSVFFPHDLKKTDAARITKVDIEIFDPEF